MSISRRAARRSANTVHSTTQVRRAAACAPPAPAASPTLQASALPCAAALLRAAPLGDVCHVADEVRAQVEHDLADVAALAHLLQVRELLQQQLAVVQLALLKGAAAAEAVGVERVELRRELAPLLVRRRAAHALARAADRLRSHVEALAHAAHERGHDARRDKDACEGESGGSAWPVAGEVAACARARAPRPTPVAQAGVQRDLGSRAAPPGPPQALPPVLAAAHGRTTHIWAAPGRAAAPGRLRTLVS